MGCEGDGDESSLTIALQWGCCFWVGVRGREESLALSSG